VILVLSWVIWWILVKLLDRLPAVAAVARERRVRAFLRRVLAWLRGWWQRGQDAASLGLAEYRAWRAVRRRERAADRLEGLAPRAVILAAYRRVLREASTLGWRRPPAQTPGEFAARLARGISLAPSSAEEAPHRGDRARIAGDPAGDVLRELTEAFQEARYSRHAISPARAGRVLLLWRTLRRRLRREKR
jgi:hypothetical protein